MYSKLFSAVAVTVALLAGAAAPATAATVKGLIVDKTTWDAGYDSNMLPMMLYPYMRTASQLLAESSGGYVVVLQNATNNLYYKYADLTSDSNIVQVTNFLSLQDSTAVNMQFEADSTKISPTATSSSWSLSGINLQPFGVNASTCDFEAAMLCGARVLASAYAVLSGGTGWANCATVGVADVKTCFAPPTGTGCLAALIQALSTVMGYCQTSISTVSMICTDGTDGAEALCAYVNAMKPSGVASSTVVTSADADGTVSSTKGNGGSGATAVTAAGVAVAAAAIAATLLL